MTSILFFSIFIYLALDWTLFQFISILLNRFIDLSSAGGWTIFMNLIEYSSWGLIEYGQPYPITFSLDLNIFLLLSIFFIIIMIQEFMVWRKSNVVIKS